MDKITFTGAGCNGSSLLGAVSRAINSPSKDTVPAGATWPFVLLSINDKSVKFTMLQISRHAQVSQAVVKLSKYGYIFFHNPDDSMHDFGFAHIKVKSVLGELQKRDYNLDSSCSDNLKIARISLALLYGVPLVIFVMVTILSILRPNGF